MPQHDIYYTIEATGLGGLLVAATERGVCAVTLGDDAADLAAGLAATFPGAALHEDGDFVRADAARLQAYLSGAATALDLPLDIDGTDFQRDVWAELRRIPYGETRTYRDVALALGKPGAVRAVGAACGANRVALVIPCHRVVRSDGSGTGFRWGAARKLALLDLERRNRGA